MIPLSMLGISREDKELLSTRLFPEANKILIERLAEENGFDINAIEHLDYSDHPVYKMKKWEANKKQKAALLQKRIDLGEIDISEYEYKYKTIEEAQANPDETHVVMKGGQSLEKLHKEIEEAKIQSKEKNLEKIEEEPLGPDVVII